VVEHPEYGEVIQLQGDQRNRIKDFLRDIGIAREEQLKVIQVMLAMYNCPQSTRFVGQNTSKVGKKVVFLLQE
jgi:hypothetical protein